MRRTVRSRRVGTAVRKLREDAQLDQATLAERIGISQSHLSRVETGLKLLDHDGLRALASAVNATQRQRRELEQLAARAHVPGWWQDYGDVLPSPVEMLVELGEEAASLRTFDTVYVQSMLQTREYAEAVIRCGPHVRGSDMDRLVELRMLRQERLDDEDFRLTAVMTEGVVRQQTGGREVMRAQLHHLLDVSDRYNVTVRVLPFTAGAHPGSESVVIFGFPGLANQEAAYVGSETAEHVYDKRDAIRRSVCTFDAVLVQSLTPHESSDLIKSVLKEM